MHDYSSFIPDLAKMEKSCRLELEVDMISSLPGHVVDNILSHLPSNEAVRTSVLSSTWRYKWFTLPSMVLDKESVLVSSQDQTVLRNDKLVNIVDHFLSNHTGPIQKFKLSHPDLLIVSDDIDRWIVLLSTLPVKKFILDVWRGSHRYKLHSSLYLFKGLIHLELHECILTPPATLNCFKSLKSLDLHRITMEQAAFENLMDSCPLLERLKLCNFDGFTHLKIHAPKLLVFDVWGVFEDITFQNTSHIVTVIVGLYIDGDSGPNLCPGKPGGLLKIFAQLPRVQWLTIGSFFFKYLSAGEIPVKLPALCNYLNFLSIEMNFCDMKENMVALCILRSSPNLQKLVLLARPQEQGNLKLVENVSEKGIEDRPFNQLSSVKFEGVVGHKQDLKLIKFLLENSPALEKMIVKPATSWEMQKALVKEFLCFKRASVNAQIIYQDP